MTAQWMTNVNVLNVRTGQYDLYNVKIDAGRFAALQTAPPSEDAGVFLDGKGYFMLPGLIDSHCHIMPSYAPLFTAAGVTTVRNTAGSFFLLSSLLEAEETAPSPRLYTTDRLIDGVPGLWGETSIGTLSTEDEALAVREVRRQASLGARFIKVYGRLKKEVMAAVVREAQACGLDVSADIMVSTEVDARSAAGMGVKFLEHNSGMMQALFPDWRYLGDAHQYERVRQCDMPWAKIEALCEHLLSRNVVLVPTTVLFDQMARKEDHWQPSRVEDSCFASFQEQWHQTASHVEPSKYQLITEYTKAFTETYVRLGGTILAGTDAPIVYIHPGYALHRELALLVESGLSPLAALQSATIVPAQVLGETEIGAIEVGKKADFILLREDPLENITAIDTIEKVAKSGKLYDPQELQEVAKAKENQVTEAWYHERIQEFEAYMKEYEQSCE
ncbi:amidohydrolase family protein [Bacillus sp. FSL W7-1360]